MLDTLKLLPEFSQQATQMDHLLESCAPVIMPLQTPVPGQLTPHQLIQVEVREYPSLLQLCAGPPVCLGQDRFLGFVAAECALVALRQGEVQAALAALFLMSLCTSELEEPAIEALHHMIVECDPQGSIGLFELGGRRSGTPRADMQQLRRRHSIRFATAAVQLNATVLRQPA